MSMEAASTTVAATPAPISVLTNRSRGRRAEPALEWTLAAGCNAFLVDVVAPRDDVIERLSARQRAGNDASEAGPGLYDAMRAEHEPLDEWPEEKRTSIDTSSPDWRDAVKTLAAGSRLHRS